MHFSQKNTQRFWIDKKERLPFSGVSIFFDWMCLLGGITLLAIVLLIWSVFLYNDVFSNSSLITDKTNPKSRIDEAQLQTISDRYTTRETQFKEQTNGFIFSDSATPSASEIISGDDTATTTSITTRDTATTTSR